MSVFWKRIHIAIVLASFLGLSARALAQCNFDSGSDGSDGDLVVAAARFSGDAALPVCNETAQWWRVVAFDFGYGPPAPRWTGSDRVDSVAGGWVIV